MKKTILFLIILISLTARSQNYQISFASGDTIHNLDSVKVENLTKATNITLSANDILNLIVSKRINTPNTKLQTPNSLHVYPNPMTENCYIDFQANSQGNATIQLYDIAGKKLSQISQDLIQGYHTFMLSGLSSGIYIIKIQSNTYSFNARIISSSLRSGSLQIKHTQIVPLAFDQNNDTKTDSEKSTKSNKSQIDMSYNTGDILKLTGFSGIYSSIFAIIPTKSQTVTFNITECGNTIIDTRDGRSYKTIKIANQCWMAENLNIGIRKSSISEQTNNFILEKYCYNNDTNNCKIYGGLYQWEEMMQYPAADFVITDSTQGICPSGWHVPTDIEWTTLSTTLFGDSVAGGMLKEKGTEHWISPNTGADNSIGFNALPAGRRGYVDGSLFHQGFVAVFWTSTKNNNLDSWYRFLDCYDPNLFRFGDGGRKNDGFSVRCLKNK